uniref:Uncharacterized protein n=1 Tax=Octopus bimaculoides TaxID=37653 RepID=A0A0L8GLS2_OCTBM
MYIPKQNGGDKYPLSVSNVSLHNHWSKHHLILFPPSATSTLCYSLIIIIF